MRRASVIVALWLAAAPLAAGELEEARRRAAAGDVDGAIAVLEPLRAAAADEAALVLLAQLYLQRERTADAFAVLAVLARRADAAPELLYDAGRLAAALKRTDEAVAFLGRAAAADPGSEARRLLGMIHVSRGELGPAYLQLRPWTRVHPDDLDGRLAAAFCAIKLERIAEAEELLTGIPAEAPRVRILWGELRVRQADYRAAIEILTPILQRPPGGIEVHNLPPPGLEQPVRRLLGRAYLGDHRPEEAIKVLAGTEGEEEMALLLAEAHYEAGDAEAAAAVLRGHASGREVRLEVLQELGRYLLLAGRPEEALPLLERAVAGDPGHEPSWQSLSQALYASGRRDEAVRAAQRARELAQTSRSPAQEQEEYHWRIRNPAESRLREALRRHAAGDAEGALEIVQHEARLDPEKLRPRLLASLFLLELGRPQEALAAAEEAVRLAPEAGDPYLRRALAFVALGRRDEAETDLRRAREMTPDHPGATNQLAVLLAERGELPAAIELLEGLLAAHPDNAVARDNLERMRLRLGRQPPGTGAEM